MKDFDLEHFAKVALSEALFYDEEYGAIGAVSLIDESQGKELFIASYSPEDDKYVIEEANRWESYSPNGDDDIGYQLAIDSKPSGLFDSPVDAADQLLALAADGDLRPSVSLLFEIEDGEGGKA